MIENTPQDYSYQRRQHTMLSCASRSEGSATRPWAQSRKVAVKTAYPVKPVGLNVRRMTIRLQLEGLVGNPRDHLDLKVGKNNCLCKQHSYPQTTTSSGLRCFQQLGIVVLGIRLR